MYLKYTVKFDDLIAFNIYQFKNSPTVQRQSTIGQISVTVAIFILFLCLATLIQEFIFFVIGIFFSLIFFFMFNFLSIYFFKLSLNKILKEGNHQGIIGEHELWLANNDIVEKTNVDEYKRKISAIERIEYSSRYTFLYISATQAFVIPKSSIIEGDIETFLQELNRRRDNLLKLL